MDTKLKNICSDFHETLFTSLILFDNLHSISFNKKDNQEEINFKYTEKTGKIDKLYTKIYSNLGTGDFSINKISEFFFISNVSLFEDWFNDFQFNYYLNNKDKYPVDYIEKIKLKNLINKDVLDKFWENEIRRYILDKNMSQNICQRLVYFTEHILCLKIKDIPFDLKKIYEISLSRNCLVHNKGNLDNKYLSLGEEFQLHKAKVVIDRNYIINQVDLFLKITSIYRDSI